MLNYRLNGTEFLFGTHLNYRGINEYKICTEKTSP